MLMFESALWANIDVTKCCENENRGIRSTSISRTMLGFVRSGTKRIHLNDTSISISQGEIFLLDRGLHYEENIPSANAPYEQIAFYLSASDIYHLLFNLNAGFGNLDLARHHCSKCRSKSVIAQPADKYIVALFSDVNRMLQHASNQEGSMRGQIKLNELFYLILNGEESCLKHKLLNAADMVYEQFFEVVYQNLFRDISVEELASLTNRSLTSFKKDFKRIFGMPPHRWIVERRLERAKMLLISTNKTVSEVGAECGFANISHFIKLFKRRYGTTPKALHRVVG